MPKQLENSEIMRRVTYAKRERRKDPATTWPDIYAALGFSETAGLSFRKRYMPETIRNYVTKPQKYLQK